MNVLFARLDLATLPTYIHTLIGLLQDTSVAACGGLQSRAQPLHVSLPLLTLYSSSTSYVEFQAGGGKGLVDLVNQLTLERCHSF